MASSRRPGRRFDAGDVGLVVLVFGMDSSVLSGLTAGTTTSQPSTASTAFDRCRTGADLNKYRDCRFVASTNSIQGYWAGVMKGYQKNTVQTFTGQIRTGCGATPPRRTCSPTSSATTSRI